jgi:hypothetical protein
MCGELAATGLADADRHAVGQPVKAKHERPGQRTCQARTAVNTCACPVNCPADLLDFGSWSRVHSFGIRSSCDLPDLPERKQPADKFRRDKQATRRKKQALFLPWECQPFPQESHRIEVHLKNEFSAQASFQAQLRAR